jgi:membrane protein YqaA with SNARE-associated domain
MLSRYIKVDSQKRENVERIYRKWGSPILLFAWIPVVGDPLTVVAGGLNLNLYVFTFWVILGKAFRYVLVILTAKSF